MPHQCTDCGRTFADGSKEMLSGCPDCSGNTFQYSPDGFEESDAPTEEPPEPPEPPGDSTVARTVGSAATAVRDFVGSQPDPLETPQEQGGDHPAQATGGSDTQTPTQSTTPETDSEEPATSADEPTVAPEGTAGTADAENAAQASARTDVVSRENLPPAPETATSTATPSERPVPGNDEPAASTPSDAEPGGLDELRAELNEQFESIRVIAPGQYELNLMELYDREEYIIALQEDGKYTIQVPERWEE